MPIKNFIHKKSMFSRIKFFISISLMSKNRKNSNGQKRSCEREKKILIPNFRQKVKKSLVCLFMLPVP
jgi:hypothetical protein